MHRLGFAATLALTILAGIPAIAGDLMMPNVAWKTAPSRIDMDAAFPKGATGRMTTAEVVLSCQLLPEGTLAGCRTIAQYPLGGEFVNAARSLLPRFNAYVPPEVVTAKGRAFVTVDFNFHDPTRPADAIELLDPDLIWRGGAPPPADPFPATAAKAGYASGLGIVDCRGGHDGVLTDCIVASEAPQGVGFGQAAIASAQAMPLNLWQDGAPVEGSRFRLPIYFDAPGAPPDPTFKRTAIFQAAMGGPGTAGPYYPDRAYRSRVGGSAVIQCVLSADGSLNQCMAVSESEPGWGFIQATMIMAQRGVIRAAPRIVDGHPLASEVVQVTVPFTLENRP